jgi:uroporphyrinogen-III synthase
VCAEGRRDTLPTRLSQAGLTLYECVAYRSEPLPVDLALLLRLRQPVSLVLFSPSGVSALCAGADAYLTTESEAADASPSPSHHTLRTLHNSARSSDARADVSLSSPESSGRTLLRSRAFRLLAIGPTTADALAHANLPVHGVCARPTPDALLDVLLSDAERTQK